MRKQPFTLHIHPRTAHSAPSLPSQKSSSLGDILPPGFRNTNVASERDQSNRTDGRRQSEDQPHEIGTPRPLSRAKRRQQPARRADEKFADKEWEISERAVGGFLPSRCDRSGILVDARRVKGFADGEYRQIKCGHDVIGMDTPSQPEVAMPKPLPDSGSGRRFEPPRRQGHDENARRANRAADYH